MNIPKCPGIYLLRNKINGKCYVGETINLWQRYRQYKWAHQCCKEYIVCSILKYGFENFEFIILKTVSGKNKTVLWIYENYYIKQYNSLNPNGYNLKPWGRGHLGCKLSIESKQKISIANSGKNNGMYGKTHSDEYKKRRSELSKQQNYAAKSVKQIDIATGEVIKIWPSAKEAALNINGTIYSHIAEVCRKKIDGEGYLVKSWKGYGWEYNV